MLLLCAAVSASADPLDNWQQRRPATDGFWRRIRHANELFLVPGYFTNYIYTSPDGINWSSRPLPRAWPLLRDVAWGNGIYLAVGSDQGTVYASTNGVDWTAQYMSFLQDMMAVSFGAGKFVAVGGTTVCTTTNGIDWTPQVQLPSVYLYCVTYGGGQFIIGGYDGTIFSSPDGLTWAPQSSGGRTERLESVAYGNGIFVMAGSFRSDVLLTSTDGTNWIARYQNGASQSLYEVAFGEGVFVVGSEVMVSTNGTNWETRAPQATGSMCGIAYGSRTFVGLNGTGSIIQTDPLNTASLAAQDATELRVFGLRGRTYRIECTDDLTPVSRWRVLGPITLTNSPQAWRDTAPNPFGRWYRTVWPPAGSPPPPRVSTEAEW